MVMCKAINVQAREWLLRPEIRAVVHLQLNVLNLAAWEAFKAVHVDLVVKVPHVTDDGVALHLLHVLRSDDHGIACARDKDVNFTHDGLPQLVFPHMRIWNFGGTLSFRLRHRHLLASRVAT